MKKLFTLIALMTCFMTAQAKEIVDAFVDFSTVTEIPRFGWGGSESAFARLSLVNGCLHFHSEEATDPAWDCQFFPIGGVDAEVGVTYTLHYKVKGTVAQNCNMGGFGQNGWGWFPITTEWVEGTLDYECTEANGNLLMQCGDYVGDWDIAYLKITHEGKEERPIQWNELLVNGDAEKSWTDLGLDPNTRAGDNDNNYKICFWTKEKGTYDDNEPKEGTSGDPHPAEIVALPEGGHAFICRATIADTPDDAQGNKVSAWDNQVWFESPRAWKTGEQFKLSFKYKASKATTVPSQYHLQAPGNYKHWQAIGNISFTTEWQEFEQVVTVPSDANGSWSIALNLNDADKDAMDFYFDDLSWSEMVLDHGYFVTATNSVSGMVDYDFDTAAEFEVEEDFLVATVGTVGKEDTWVDQLMISTVRGNDRQFKANTLKVKGALRASRMTDEFEDWNWNNIEEGASASIKLPAQGVWKIYYFLQDNVMAFVQIEGDPFGDPIEIVPNTTEVVVHGVERDWLGLDDQGNPKEEQVGEGQPWDNQFILMANRALKAGEVTVIEFDYVATVDAKTNTQCGEFGNPGGYVFWNALGDVDFTTTEQHFTKTYTVPGDANGMGAFNFNMAVIKPACDYTIKNVVWKLEDETESLIDMEGTKNFFVKEGAGTAPYQFGTDPSGISNTVVEKNQSNVVYNLAGQRVSNSFKGIAIKNGHKVVLK